MEKSDVHTNTERRASEKAKFALANEAQAIYMVLFDAQESLKVTEYLLQYDPDRIHNLLLLNSFWHFTLSVHVDHILLKLSILFTRSEHYSIAGLLDNLKGGGKFAHLILDSKIQEWETETERLNAITEKIRLSRNKRIAHMDREYGRDAHTDISIKEVRETISLVQTIVDEIYSVTGHPSFKANKPISSPVDSLRIMLEKSKS